MYRVSALLSILLLLAPNPLKAKVSGMWQEIAAEARARTAGMARSSIGQAYRLDTSKMSQRLASADLEGQVSSDSIIELPINGKIRRFRLEESPIMAPGLAARYPEIKTYRVQGIDNPYASGRLSMTPRGFHGMVTSPGGTYYIDPQGGEAYVTYRREQRNPGQPFSCGVAGHTHSAPLGRFAARTSQRVPGNLKVYRLAVAATAEYVAAVSSAEPSVDEAQAEIVIAINRVNQIYERDLAIRLELVDNNQRISYTNPATDPYSNFNTNAMLGQNQTTIDSVIRSNRYDIGHVFATGQGGVAYVGSACNNSFKAGGVTGLTNPTGDAFYIDYVAHEIGHQLGADHSFNGTSSGCGPGRYQDTAFEPGSGTTIMSYSGICGVENVQANSDAMFHAGSIAQIDVYTGNGNGANCAQIYAITNNPSQPIAAVDTEEYVIPILTPFALTGSGNDADGDTLSYTWDQMDAGSETNAGNYGLDLVDNALIRSRLPQAQPRRDFTQLNIQLTGATDNAEVLPTRGRDLNFRFGVRDGKSGIAWDDVRITTDQTAGPFAVTSHLTAQTLFAESAQTVTWSVAGTGSGSPVDCPLVDIDLLMLNDSSSSYCVSEPLRTGVTNNGTASVILPDENVPNARFRVSCANNIFYALSRADIEIFGGSSAADTSCQAVLPALEEHELENIAARETISASSGGGGGRLGVYSLLVLLVLGLGRRLLAPGRYAGYG